MPDMAYLCKSKGDPGLAEARGDEPPDLHLRLWDVLLKTSLSHPDRDAFVCLWQPQTQSSIEAPKQRTTALGTRLSWTYRELREKAELLAERLRNRGCRPGTHMVALLWNSAEWALLFWVSARLRMTFVPIDPNSADEARSIIAMLRPHAVVVQTRAEIDGLGLSGNQMEEQGVQLRICCSCSTQEAPGWLSLCEVSSSPADSEPWPAPGVTQDEHSIGHNRMESREAALIVFTSGTTGSPKGCPHTNRNLVSQSCDFDPETNPSTSHRWLVHTPVFHIFAINNALRAWRYGGAVVFPSKSFDVGATLAALVEEKCTVMSATPTLVKALLAHSSFPTRKEMNLHLVTIGGTDIGPEDIRLCREGLGTEHAIQVYGLSEGAPLITWKRDDPLLIGGYHPGVGKVLPGAAVRVCRPGSCDILHRSQLGELHISGPSVIAGYLNEDNEDMVYREGSEIWLKTGDQAKIDGSGVVYILGRYKDLIIRGGENIYPTRIESKLMGLLGVQAQVVGVEDSIAGQVPVAIVKLSEGVTKAEVAEKARTMGHKYHLAAIYTLSELGLRAFPTTAIGKAKKEVLRQAVAAMYQPSLNIKVNGNKTPPEPVDSLGLSENLLDIWQELTGTRPLVHENIMYLADSITLLRYCEKVLRLHSRRLYLQDFLEHDTVTKQAQLLATRDQQQSAFDAASELRLMNGSNGAKIREHANPPPKLTPWSSKVHEVKPRAERSSPFNVGVWESARQAVFRVDLQEHDIEDILPIRDSLYRTAIGVRPQSYENRLVFGIRNVTTDQIREALMSALSCRAMMRTMVFRASNQELYHAVLSPTRTVFGLLVRDFQVQSEEEAMKLGMDDSPDRHSVQFMFQAHLVKIHDSSDHYLSMTFNHSAIDGMSLSQWHRELDQLLIDPNKTLAAVTPFRLFSDLFSQYDCSRPAQDSVNFHVKRLRGISRFQQALWPVSKAPGWMVSNDEASLHAADRDRARHSIWSGTWENKKQEFQYPRCCRAVWLPDLSTLKEQHKVHPSLLAKSALAIFNVLQTGSAHALFTAWESGRSWPFVPAWMENLLPPAMSIDGATAEWILNMIEVRRDETVTDFFQRMIVEQGLIGEHVHVPWGQVIECLGDEGPIAEDASHRQGFVWDVSLGLSAVRSQRLDFTVLEPKARYGWADNGIFWNAFSLDKENIYFIASWDTAQMNDFEVDACCDCLAEVMRKLGDSGNWERKVGEVFGIRN